MASPEIINLDFQDAEKFKNFVLKTTLILRFFIPFGVLGENFICHFW